MVVPKAGPEPLDDLARFLEPFGQLLGRAENRAAMERYSTGLLSDVTRKTAAEIGRCVPDTNGQRLQEFLTRTPWDFREMDRRRIERMLQGASIGEGVLIVDDTGLPKKGRCSVGVARQYSGTLGRVDNCQVVVSSHYVDGVFDWPVNARVYLPEAWTSDRERCRKAHVPDEIVFRTKGQISLQLIDEALEAGLGPRAVVADTGYGDQTSFLDGLQQRRLPYLVGVSVTSRFRLAEQVEADPGEGPPPPYPGRGRPRKAPNLEDRVPAQQAGAILDALPKEAWKQVAWRQGTQGALVKEAARVRVYRSGHRGRHLPSLGWLIGERPLPGRKGDRKCYFAWELAEEDLVALIGLAHVRWVIERFYQDAKGQLGLDDYEGRLWPGLHRHIALVMLAHCFLTLRQSYGADIDADTELDADTDTPVRTPPGKDGITAAITTVRSAVAFPP